MSYIPMIPDHRDRHHRIYDYPQNQSFGVHVKQKSGYNNFRQGYHMRNPPSYHHNHHQHVVHDMRNMLPVVFPCMVSSPASQIQAGILRLGFEIENLCKRMQPRKDKEAHKARETLIARIGEVIGTKWPTAKVEVFGSFKTNLYLPTSDIDLVVVDSTWRIPPFYELKDELIAHNICDREKVIVLDNASVPIVKLTDKLNGVKVDIGFNIANAQESAKLTQEFISLYPCLPYLVIVLKQFLVERELNEVYSGGMSSYSLILMVISFLKQMRRCESSNYGEHLFRFLHFYGYEFDYLKFSVSIRSNAGFVTRNDTRSLLSIRDPLCASNDVARGSYRFVYVHHAFRDAYWRLLRRLEAVSSPPGLASREPVILSEIVKTPYLPQYTHFDKSHFTESHVGVSNSTGSMSSASSEASSGSFGDTDSDSEVPAKVVLSEATAEDSSQKLYADVVKSSVAIPKPSSSTDLSQLDAEKPASVADTNCDRSGKLAKEVETEAMLDRLSLNVKLEKEEKESAEPADKTSDDNKEGVTEQPYADEMLRIVPFAVQKCTLHNISSSAIEDPVS